MFYNSARRYRLRRFAVLRSMPLNNAPNSWAVISRRRSPPSPSRTAYVPSSSRLLQTAKPSRSQYRIFTRSLRRLANTNRCPLEESELALRIMAREDRFSRRMLGRAFREFLDVSGQGRVRSRMLKSPSGVVYVFLALPHGTDRQLRIEELGCRCFVARGRNQDCSTVVGLATEQYEKGKGFSLDLSYVYIADWTADKQHDMEGMQRDLGFFTNPGKTEIWEDEYPGSPPNRPFDILGRTHRCE